VAYPTADLTVKHDLPTCRYTDVTGQLCGVPGAECLIEVKATVGDASRRFPITSKEWDLAMDCWRRRNDTSTGTARLYVIIRVERVLTQPRIAAVLPDPAALWDAGQLQLSFEKLFVESFPCLPLASDASESAS
jgi:hypothetical protein